MSTTTKPLTAKERQLIETAYQVALDKLKTTTHPVKRQCLIEELTDWCTLLDYPTPTQLRH